MCDESIINDELEGFYFAEVVAGFISAGFINPIGKTREQILIEVIRLVRRNKQKDISFVNDYTKQLLVQARVYRRQGNNEFSCLFYALWFEHTINGFISTLAIRMQLPNDVIGSILRDTSYKSKISWVLLLLGRKQFNKPQLTRIMKLMEARNTFVHYKWKVGTVQIDKELEQILLDIEKTVRYVCQYGNKYVVGISRRKISKLIEHT